MANPFTAKAKGEKPKLRAFGAASSKNGKIKPWKQRIEEQRDHETRGIVHSGSAKADFVHNGIRFCNVRDHAGWWSIDVVTGDTVMTFHNRYGSWMSDVGGGKMREPTREVAFALQERWLTEMKRIGARLPFWYRTEKDKRESRRDKEAV